MKTSFVLRTKFQKNFSEIKIKVLMKMKNLIICLISPRGPIFEAGSFLSSWRARRGTSTSRPPSQPCSWPSCCSWISKSPPSLSTEKSINSKWEKTFEFFLNNSFFFLLIRLYVGLSLLLSLLFFSLSIINCLSYFLFPFICFLSCCQPLLVLIQITEGYTICQAIH